MKLGHMVLHIDAVYIVAAAAADAEYNLYFLPHKKYTNAFELVSAKAFLLIALLRNGQEQSFLNCRNVPAESETNYSVIMLKYLLYLS